MKKFFLFLGLSFFSYLTSISFWELSPDFAKSVLSKMSLREKVGQLIIPSAVSYDSDIDKKMIERLITEYKIGGIMFMYGSPQRQIKLVNHYQNLSNIPLLISQDCEWGFAMRLKNAIAFPKNLTMGALSPEDDNLIKLVGQEIGRQSLLLGVNVCFAPVADVNNNPKNPTDVKTQDKTPSIISLFTKNGFSPQNE